MTGRDAHRVTRALVSIAVFVGVVVVVPAGLVAVARARFGSPIPVAGLEAPRRWSRDDAGASLSEPIADDTLVDVLVRACITVIWAAVVVVAVTTVIEVLHMVRHGGLSMPSIRGLGWAQQIARYIAAGLIVLIPVSSSASLMASMVSASSLTAPPDAAAWPARAVVATDSIAQTRTRDASPDGWTPHVVRPGESVYSIAERLAAGDQRDVIEIAEAILDANLGSSMGRGERFTNPAYIEVGWILRVPGAAYRDRPAAPDPVADEPPIGNEPNAAADYVVRPGDTLWSIADEQLGDAEAWQEIWERNADDAMGDGRTFDDPDLILPGWELDLPDDTRRQTPPATPRAVDQDQAGAVVDAVEQPVTEGTSDGPAVLDEPTVEAPKPISTEPTFQREPGDVVRGPLPITPVDDVDIGTVPSSTSPSTSPASSSSTSMPTAIAPSEEGPIDGRRESAPEGPSPIRLEHAALLAAGILTLVGVRRHRRLRSALPRHRVPDPRPEVIETERRLRAIDAGERALRVDVACRAAAWSLVETGAQIGWAEVSNDGDVALRLTAPAALPLPWAGDAQSWTLAAEVPIELLSADARRVAMPCVALVHLGVTANGGDVLVDLEACGVLGVGAAAAQADEVVSAIAAGLASSMSAEVAHLIGVSLPPSALLGHRNAHHVESADAAFELAASLVGTTVTNERTTFELRSLRTGGEMWEPAVILLTSADVDDVDGISAISTARIEPGHGFGVVAAMTGAGRTSCMTSLRAEPDRWVLHGFGSSIELTPIGLSPTDLAAVDQVLTDAEQTLEAIDLPPADDVQWVDARPASAPVDSGGTESIDTASSEGASTDVVALFEPMPHEIVVGLLGAVEVTDRRGNAGRFERSKTVELIAWLATHRARPTRTGARTALWELDVRDATFANVVSEARRAMARLVAPPLGEEWVGRTLTERLPLHDAVVTDVQLVEQRVAHARLQPPNQALETLRPAVAMIRDMPFAGTSYLWPDAEGITSNLVLLAITASMEYAGHALSIGDTDGVFWATSHGLTVLPGHEELIGLRMRAHARSGDLAGVRQEWASYERVLVADAWSDGEPAPKLLALRHELLTA